MRIDWKNVISVDMEYPDKTRAKDILYVEYKDGRLEKVVYPRGIPSDELVEMLNLADEKKIDLKVIEENSEEKKLNEDILAAQKFNDETEALVIDGNGDEKVAYVKKYDGTVEKIPYSEDMNRFIHENLKKKERGEISKFFEISNDPEVAEGQVKALEEVIEKRNNQTPVDNSTYSDELVEEENKENKTDLKDIETDGYETKNNPTHEEDSEEDINIYSGRDDMDPMDLAYNTFNKDSKNTSDLEEAVEEPSDVENNPEEVTEVEDQNLDTEANELNDDEVENEDELDTRADKLEKNYNKKKAAKIAIGVAAGVLGAAGIAAAVTSCNKNTNKNKNEESTNKSFESLMNSMKKDDERRVFAENVFSVTEALNSKALDKDVFALEEDGEATLHFTYDEVAAAKLVLNNYTSEEMYKIFGTDEIDTNDIMVKYQSFTTKMSLYAMNGKAPSGVASLISNEANRTWFEKIENSIVEFNKAPNSTNADKVIRTFAYFYNHGINGSDGIENDEATLSCVKNLAFNMICGYRDANGEKDYQQYLVVSTAPGSFDDQYRTNKESQVQKGERLSDHIKIAESGPCTIQNVRRHIESLVERLATGRIENKDKKEKSSRPSYTEIRKAAASTIDSNMEIEDDVLYMNRIRGLTKIDSKDESEYTVTKEVWDKMTTEERLDFAKKNGKVISNTKKTTTEKVDESKLTDKEKEEADKQKTYEVNGHKFNSLECKEAYKEGYLAAHNYANEVGAYKHSAIYNSMDIDNSYVVIEEDAGTLNDVAKNRYAYEGRETLLSDSQIQRRLEKDVNNYKNSGSNVNDNMVNAYKLGWTESMNTALEADKQNGKAEREEAERLYKEAQEEAKRENEKTPTKDENEKPGNDVDEPNIPTFDENDDPYLDGPDPDIVDPDTVGKEYSAIPEAEVKNYQSSINSTNDTIDKTTEISEEDTSSNDEYEADEMPDLDIEVSEADLDSYFDSYINNNEEVKTLSLKR